MTTLRGITWDHPRGVDALSAASTEFSAYSGGTSIQWTARPLHEFEDTPVTMLAKEYDLLAIDHPFIGDAVDDGALFALDDVLSAGQLAERAADSAGLSHASYHWHGKQWALAVDAACMVSAYRPDILDADAAPRTWLDVASLSRSLGRDRLLLAANPTHLWGTLLSLCECIAPAAPRQIDGRPAWWSNDGIDADIGAAAVEMLREILAQCAPESLESDPITVLERLSHDERIAYSPLVFGYVTYARPRNNRHVVSFGAAPTGGAGSVGTLTGGVGLAVSSHSAYRDKAADFVRFVTDADLQRGLYVDSGGQPGRRSAWIDPRANDTSGGFYAKTLDTMDRSFLRPRHPGYPEYQRRAAAALHAMVIAGATSREIAGQLGELWDKHVRV